MTKEEIEEYQLRIIPWQKNADVTNFDFIFYDIIDLQCDLANDIIEKMIASN